MDYLAIIEALWAKGAFFVYGVICGYVIHFFEGEPFNSRNIQKIFAFGFIALFSNVVSGVYLHAKNDEEVLVTSMVISCCIYFLGLYIFKPENKEKIGAILIKFIAKKTGLPIENKETKKKVVIPKKEENNTKK